MFKKNIPLLFIVIISLYIPFTTSAFWWFNQTPTIQTETNILDTSAKTVVLDKYKIWEDSFEKKNIKSVITNSDKFIFTIPELNYLFETETQNIQNPTITNVVLSNDGDNIKVTADFHKFINGHFSFTAKVVSVENKMRLELSSASLYGIPIPKQLLESPINLALDNYFSFLYKYPEYKGFDFIIKDNSLQFKPGFTN